MKRAELLDRPAHKICFGDDADEVSAFDDRKAPELAVQEHAPRIENGGVGCAGLHISRHHLIHAETLAPCPQQITVCDQTHEFLLVVHDRYVANSTKPHEDVDVRKAVVGLKRLELGAHDVPHTHALSISLLIVCLLAG